MLFHTNLHCFLPCSHNICPLHNSRMSRACIHSCVHYHPVFSVCRESLDMAYQCVANKVMQRGGGRAI